MTVPMLDTIIHLAAENKHQGSSRSKWPTAAGLTYWPTSWASRTPKSSSNSLEPNRATRRSTSNVATSGWSGDVKYHMGARKVYTENGVMEMPITLAPNPSHLEFVDPVVIGRARAAQEVRSQPGASGSGSESVDSYSYSRRRRLSRTGHSRRDVEYVAAKRL